jgi:hypothetical protein
MSRFTAGAKLQVGAYKLKAGGRGPPQNAEYLGLLLASQFAGTISKDVISITEMTNGRHPNLCVAVEQRGK